MKTYTLIQNPTYNDYLAIESELVTDFAHEIIGTQIEHTPFIRNNSYGIGTVLSCTGTTFAAINIEVNFDGNIKRLALMGNFVKFVDSDIYDLYNDFMSVHNTLTQEWFNAKHKAAAEAKAAEKQAEAEKKAEIKYEKLREKAIKDFENLVQRSTELSDIDEFYYSLGWLTRHIGSVSATMPDYLSDAFKKQFGHDAVHKTVDSKKKTSNGNAMQWTFGFKATLRKAENVPSYLTQYLSSTGKAIASTSFIWDLVENYGFRFGKEQDIDRIVDCIPSQFLASYEAGMVA